MSIHADYWLTCDICETDTTDSRPTLEEAIEYAERGGWSIYDLDENLIMCEDCIDFWKAGQS